MQITRLFDWSSHEQFARISCDFNPIHMDATAARRTHSGAPIVHGIHSLIWLLDCMGKQLPAVRATKTLKAQFLQPIFVGDEVSFELVESNSKMVRSRLLVGTEEVLTSVLGFDEMEKLPLAAQPAHTSSIVPPDSPRDLSLEEMTGAAGCLSFGPLMPQIGTLFPQAVTAFGMQRIAALVSSSCLVGMVVPGLHSLFSGLDVAFCDDNSERADAIRFAVLSVAARFRLVRIGIGGQRLRGLLETVSRVPPVKQPSMDRAISSIAKNEFKNSIALVVGGSRGLGELTAKLLAAGGSHVVMTYVTGKTDAEAVAGEISTAGARCDVIAYDVRQPAAVQLVNMNVIPTHLYYFATPAIFRRKAGIFDERRFEEFNTFYLSGFFDLVQMCLRMKPSGVRAFYPSSSALENRPANMTEYSMSKAAAEVLCADLSKFLAGVHIVTRRLPRLPTDQTSSVVQVRTVDPIATMLPILREMHL